MIGKGHHHVHGELNTQAELTVHLHTCSSIHVVSPQATLHVISVKDRATYMYMYMYMYMLYCRCLAYNIKYMYMYNVILHWYWCCPPPPASLSPGTGREQKTLHWLRECEHLFSGLASNCPVLYYHLSMVHALSGAKESSRTAWRKFMNEWVGMLTNS